jgi:acetyl-CoA C-acetyltransferase
MFQKEFSLEKVLSTRVIASPLKSLDCCANADGASCLIVANEAKAKKFAEHPVWIKGLGLGSTSMSLAGRNPPFTGFESAKEAARQAYSMAGVKPKDIDVAEVHDCFTIAELIAYGDLGFCKREDSPKMIRDEETHLSGRIPVNIDGGLLSKGHPVGATGGSQIRTLVHQLRGEGGKVQVDGAKIALGHNVGGIGMYTNVTILEA